jgi:diadenosine tetraphosphate (Ap4A) HIT family hydrolase
MQQQPQEHWRRLLLRTEEVAKNYEAAQKNRLPGNGCRLCNDSETLAEYEYWRVMPNAFPYDRYFTKSDMLVLKRHTDELGLTDAEYKELLQLKSTVLMHEYDHLLDNLPKQKSIPHHCHFHLISFKRPEGV